MREAIVKANRRLIDANGKQIPLLGTITLPVLFGKTIRDWVFWVADSVHAPMILGNNIIKHANILDEKKIIEIGSDSQPVSFERLKDVAYTIYAKHDAHIPPGCSYWMRGMVH
jgi:hypothetical protein